MQLHRDRERIAEAGARLVVIGQETPRHAARFIERFDLDGLELLVDPERRTYELAGTKIGTVGELLGRESVVKGVLKSIRTRTLQGRIEGHAAQLGGVLVVAPGGEVTWAHLSDNPADVPPNDEVLEALREARDGAEAG